MSFSTEVELSLSVPSSELRSARRQIEGGIGATRIGGDGPAARATRTDGGASGVGGGRRGRRMFRWARQRTSYMETTVELLSSIESKVDDGGGGGGFLSGFGARSIIGGIGGGLGVGALSGALTLPAAEVLAVSGTLGLAASAVLAVTGTIDMDAESFITTTGTLTLGIASIVAVTGTLGLSAAAVLAVTGTLGLAAAGVLAVTGTMAMEASNVLSVTGVLTVGAAAALAVTGTLSVPAAAAIAVVGTVTIGAGELVEILGPGEEARREIIDRPQEGTSAPPGYGPDVNIPSDAQRGDVDSFLQQRPNTTEETRESDERLQQSETRLNYQPRYEVSAERDEQAIIDEVRKQQEDDIDALREEIRRAARSGR